MIREIKKELDKIEIEKSVKILYAVESGSRAWGFESVDSDWDVRFIYIHKLDWYLSIDDKNDSYDKILPNEIDLSGWELKKSLKLFRKSNPPLMEWLRSPIIYFQNQTFIDKLRILSQEYFNSKSCLYHYLHMAEGNFKEYLKHDIVRIKKYFYVLRPLLACSWIEEKGTMAPMEFQILLDSQIKDPKLYTEIEKLLLRKKNNEELKDEPKINILNEYIEEQINHFQNFLSNYDDDMKPSTDKLDILFRETLNEI